MDRRSLNRRLAAGLVRIAVATQQPTIQQPTIQQHTVPPGQEPSVERTIAQQQMLLILARRTRSCPLTDLAAELGMALPTVVSTSAALAREGLVRMRPCPSYAPDEVHISLTPAGRSATPGLTSWADTLLNTVEDLSETEQRQVLDMVTEQIAALQRQGRIPITRICLTCTFFDGYAYPGAEKPHHCWYVDAPFGFRELRLRCPEQNSDDREPP